ncbi:integrase core domain-containing protein [Planobispora siamensis]|uniref:Integrase catalytic domain-containing protein n=1 Tax=Planobispora siamensis TaxID=936338 RepID=A0A8J3SNL7_9ACTN|nr:integrase core domain-containing protein [Planobispora siamensis]GIH97748.1 hypothetical protein Psi01_83780 [Planobispora siamensis]
MKSLVMDLAEVGCQDRYLIRDREGKFPILMEEILAEANIRIVLTGIQIPRMNAVMERWVQSYHRELLDRCLVWNECHLCHALREYECFYNRHRVHQALNQAAPSRTVPARSWIRRELLSWEYIDGTDSAGSSTSIHMLLELHGCSFRQTQSRLSAICLFLSRQRP